MTVDFAKLDFFRADNLENPYGLYRELRRQAPVCKVFHQGMGREMYLVTTYELVRRVFGDSQMFSSQFVEVMLAGSTPNPEAEAILAQGIKRGSLLLNEDEPDHMRFRSLVNTVFTPGRVSNLVPSITQITDSLIDSFIERGTCNFVEEFAVPLPIYVIADVLGLPRELYPQIRRWSDAFLTRLSQMQSKEEDIEACNLIIDLQRFFDATIQDRRDNPRDDLITRLVQARTADGELLGRQELITILQEIMIAGNETTRNTLIGGMALFLQNPDQTAALIAEPALAVNAAEEVLRVLAPTTGMYRIATRDTELAGVAIPKGAVMLLRMDSANRDDMKFPDGEKFDIRRANAKEHLAFGYGIHHCLGSMLARREVQITFPKLLSRLRDPRIDEVNSDLTHKASILHHGMRELHLTFTPGTAAT